DEHEAERPAVAPAAASGLLEVLVEAAPVVQPGQRVAERVVAEQVDSKRDRAQLGRGRELATLVDDRGVGVDTRAGEGRDVAGPPALERPPAGAERLTSDGGDVHNGDGVLH